MATKIANPTPERLLALLEPVQVAIDPEALRVLITDRGDPIGYERWFRAGPGKAGGVGWLEFARDPHGELVTKAVSAGEVMALVRDAGREGEVAEMTLSVAGHFFESGCADGRQLARRLDDEVRAGCDVERVALRGLQARMLELIVEGDSIASMCRRGGFLDRRGAPDTSWFERRAGLAWTHCNKTGKWRIARTAPVELVGRLARAAEVDPVEVGA